MGSSPIVGRRLRSLVDERRSSEPGDVGSNPTEDACFVLDFCVYREEMNVHMAGVISCVGDWL